MINRIMEWFQSPGETQKPLDSNVAAGVLMVEIMLADDHWSEVEDTQVRTLLERSFALDTAAQDEVLDAAQQLVKESNDLYRFTSRINDVYDTDEKFNLLVALWKVAFADGEIDRYEEHMIRRISELLYLHHSHFIQAKHTALKAQG